MAKKAVKTKVKPKPKPKPKSIVRTKGRPTKFTPEVRTRIIAAIRRFCSLIEKPASKRGRVV